MASGTITLSNGIVINVASNSCADVGTGWTNWYFSTYNVHKTVSRCSADPFVAPGSLTFTDSSYTSISAITATAASSGGGTSTTIGTATGTVSAGTGTLTLTVKVEPAPPSAERIQDLSLLFGLSIVFLVSVTGAKQLLQLFQVNHEKD